MAGTEASDDADGGGDQGGGQPVRPEKWDDPVVVKALLSELESEGGGVFGMARLPDKVKGKARKKNVEADAFTTTNVVVDALRKRGIEIPEREKRGVGQAITALIKKARLPTETVKVWSAGKPRAKVELHPWTNESREKVIYT